MDDAFNAPVLLALRRLIVLHGEGRDWKVGRRVDGPWLEVDFSPRWGREASPENAEHHFAIWIATGVVHTVDEHGAVTDEPVVL